VTKVFSFLAVAFGIVGLYLLIQGANGSPTGSAAIPQVASLPTMILGVGLIAAGCLAGVLARVAQAEAHHVAGNLVPGVLMTVGMDGDPDVAQNAAEKVVNVINQAPAQENSATAQPNTW